MSISNNHILEIRMIKDIIDKSNHTDKTKMNLLETLETIISVADKIVEWGDYVDDIYSDLDKKIDETTSSEDEDLYEKYKEAVKNGEMATDSD